MPFSARMTQKQRLKNDSSASMTEQDLINNLKTGNPWHLISWSVNTAIEWSTPVIRFY